MDLEIKELLDCGVEIASNGSGAFTNQLAENEADKANAKEAIVFNKPSWTIPFILYFKKRSF